MSKNIWKYHLQGYFNSFFAAYYDELCIFKFNFLGGIYNKKSGFYIAKTNDPITTLRELWGPNVPVLRLVKRDRSSNRTGLRPITHKCQLTLKL